MSIAELKTIIKNVTVARDHLATVPEERLDLRSYRRDTPCGTLFCAAGELTTVPHFQALGLALTKLGEDKPGEWVWTLDETEQSIGDVGTLLDRIFGQRAFDILFSHYGTGKHDRILMTSDEWAACYVSFKARPISDKELILRRFNKHLNDLVDQLAIREGSVV